MKIRTLAIAAMTLALAEGWTCLANAADLFSALGHATLADVKQDEALYAANPAIPTAKAATQCLTWADAVLTNAPAGVNPFATLVVPKGVLSLIGDGDVFLSTASAGLPPIVDAFNQNCGWYMEDLKAAAASHATVFGLKLPFGL